MNFPDDTQRHAIIGRTGSGKTQAAQHHLSMRNYHVMPWVIYNFKHDKSIDEIPYSQDLPVDEIPVKPGIYITHPRPDQEEEVEKQMWAIWEKGNTGVYVDEGYMIPRGNRAFRALLTQGRSKEIPLIVLSQRPVWMDRFVFSEAEFYQVFALQDIKDVKKVQEIVPTNISKPLPKYHSYYYDVGANKVSVVSPVPDIKEIHNTFRQRLQRLKRVV